MSCIKLKWICIDARTVKQFDTLTVKNASVMHVYYVRGYTICSHLSLSSASTPVLIPFLADTVGALCHSASVLTVSAHTRTSLASESGWARVPMSQTRPCVECHEPDLADSGLARQGLRWGSTRRRLAFGSYVCGRSQARLAYPHRHKHRQCEFCH